MSDRLINRIGITEQQADELIARLCREADTSPPSALGKDVFTSKDLSSQMHNAASSEVHLTDDQFIEYSMRSLNSRTQGQIEKHIRICADCAGEVRRLSNLSHLWNEESQIQHLDYRIRSLVNPNARTQAGSIAAFLAGVHVTLKALVLPKGAFAEGQDDSSDPIEFRITADGKMVEELLGTLQRKNKEYYVRVRIPRPEDRMRFRNRRVQITLSEAGKAHPILQRDIDVGVAVLLGTALPLTDTCHVAAHLLPLTEVEEIEHDA